MELANHVGGKSGGNRNKSVTHVDELRHATENAICHCSNSSQQKFLNSTSAGIVILPEDSECVYEGDRILVKNSRLAFAQVIELLHPQIESNHVGVADSASVSSSAVIDTSAKIDIGVVIGENVIIERDVVIGAGSVIGDNVVVGAGTRIDYNVSILPNCTIGRSCQIYSGVVLGSSGFSYERDGENWKLVRNIGKLIIGDEVDIGACTSIDRGSIRDTVIGDGVKIDNNVQIGHNVQVGENTLIVANVGIAGSVKIGKRCMIGGQVAIDSHIEIADDVTVQASSLVTKSIPVSGVYSGSIPAREAGVWKRTLASLYRLSRNESSTGK